jgi:hypothetical protein
MRHLLKFYSHEDKNMVDGSGRALYAFLTLLISLFITLLEKKLGWPLFPPLHGTVKGESSVGFFHN